MSFTFLTTCLGITFYTLGSITWLTESSLLSETDQICSLYWNSRDMFTNLLSRFDFVASRLMDLIS